MSDVAWMVALTGVYENSPRFRSQLPRASKFFLICTYLGVPGYLAPAVCYLGTRNRYRMYCQGQLYPWVIVYVRLLFLARRARVALTNTTKPPRPDDCIFRRLFCRVHPHPPPSAPDFPQISAPSSKRPTAFRCRGAPSTKTQKEAGAGVGAVGRP